MRPVVYQNKNTILLLVSYSKNEKEINHITVLQ